MIHLMSAKSQVFEQTYNDYLARIAGLDFSFLAENLALQANGNELTVPFFNQPYRVSAGGIQDSAGQNRIWLSALFYADTC